MGKPSRVMCGRGLLNNRQELRTGAVDGEGVARQSSGDLMLLKIFLIVAHDRYSNRCS